MAVSEFRKINKRSPDYEKAQYHIKYALFSLSQDRYQELKGEERLDSLWSMTKTAAELGESDILKSTLETVGYELENSSTAGEAEELLKMLMKTVKNQRETIKILLLKHKIFRLRRAKHVKS